MQWNQVQIIIRSTESFSAQTIAGIHYPGVKLIKTHHFPNTHYLALDITVAANAKPGNVVIELKTGQQQLKKNFPLLARRKGNGKTFAQGVTSKDFIYLIMPDRFSNGDPSNDRYADLSDTAGGNNNEVLLRHGGD